MHTGEVELLINIETHISTGCQRVNKSQLLQHMTECLKVTLRSEIASGTYVVSLVNQWHCSVAVPHE